jgi:hypothetical protein
MTIRGIGRYGTDNPRTPLEGVGRDGDRLVSRVLAALSDQGGGDDGGGSNGGGGTPGEPTVKSGTLTGDFDSGFYAAMNVPDTSKVVIAYYTYNGDTGEAASILQVAEVNSDNTVTFGTAVEYYNQNPGAQLPALGYDPVNDKVVLLVAIKDTKETVTYVCTVTGTSISVGSKNVIETSTVSDFDYSTSYPRQHAIVYSSAAGGFLITYERTVAYNDARGGCVFGTVSGDSMTFGSVAEWQTGPEGPNNNDLIYIPEDDVFVVFWAEHYPRKWKGTVLSVSGTTVTVGATQELGSFKPIKLQAIWKSSQSRAFLTALDDEDWADIRLYIMAVSVDAATSSLTAEVSDNLLQVDLSNPGIVLHKSYDALLLFYTEVVDPDDTRVKHMEYDVATSTFTEVSEYVLGRVSYPSFTYVDGRDVVAVLGEVYPDMSLFTYDT